MVGTTPITKDMPGPDCLEKIVAGGSFRTTRSCPTAKELDTIFRVDSDAGDVSSVTEWEQVAIVVEERLDFCVHDQGHPSSIGKGIHSFAWRSRSGSSTDVSARSTATYSLGKPCSKRARKHV